MGSKYRRGMRLRLNDGVEVVVDTVYRSCHRNTSRIILRRVDNGEVYMEPNDVWDTKRITRMLAREVKV